jgi:hypothetical protein
MLPRADAEVGAGAGASDAWLYRLAAILWPAFLTACALQMLVFSWFDPRDLHETALGLQDWPPQAVETLAFLTFWILTSIGAWISVILDRAARD